MPGGSGLDLVRTLLRLDPHTRVVVLTGYGSVATAVEAMRFGAVHYLAKPADADEVLAAFQRPKAGGPDAPRFVFVGREEEQAALQALLAEPGPIVVSGPAGIGKTQLVGRLCRLAVDDGQREAVDAAVSSPLVPDAGAHSASQTSRRRFA